MTNYPDQLVYALGTATDLAEADDVTTTLWSDTEDYLMDCVCLECGHTFADDAPDECPQCGSGDLDLA